jgi:hypothetical protein
MTGRKPRSKPRPADVPVRLTLYLSREQVRAGWGRSRVQLLRAVRGALFELTGDDGGRYSPRVVFDEERTPGVLPGPARDEPAPEHYVIADGERHDVPAELTELDGTRTPADWSGPVLAPTGDLEAQDRLDAGLAEAEYHAALANLNAVRAENHLTGWAPGHLQRHLITLHGVPPSEVPYDGELDERHRREHERMTEGNP